MLNQLVFLLWVLFSPHARIGFFASPRFSLRVLPSVATFWLGLLPRLVFCLRCRYRCRLFLFACLL
jgi:hypothetical protein